MTDIRYPDLQIAANHDNTAGLTAFEAITAPNDRRNFWPPREVDYQGGAVQFDADGDIYLEGYPSVDLLWGSLTWRQWYYLRNTYCAGGYSGDVTIRLLLDNLTYANYNAKLIIPQTANTEQYFKDRPDFRAQIRKIVAI